VFFRHQILTFIWAIFIAFATLTPGESMPEVNFWDFANADKLAHFGVFAVLSFLMIRGFSLKSSLFGLKNKKIIFTIVITIMYGGLIEYAQSFIPGRSIEFNDMLANGFGSAIGVFVYLFLKKNNFFGDFL